MSSSSKPARDSRDALSHASRISCVVPAGCGGMPARDSAAGGAGGVTRRLGAAGGPVAARWRARQAFCRSRSACRWSSRSRARRSFACRRRQTHRHAAEHTFCVTARRSAWIHSRHTRHRARELLDQAIRRACCEHDALALQGALQLRERERGGVLTGALRLRPGPTPRRGSPGWVRFGEQGWVYSRER